MTAVGKQKYKRNTGTKTVNPEKIDELIEITIIIVIIIIIINISLAIKHLCSLHTS
jgi:hypothetical protein